MNASPFPRQFDGAAVIVMDQARSFERFQANERVALRDTVADYAWDFDFKYLQEGPCLVALEGSLAFETRPHPRLFSDRLPACDPKECVLSIAANLWLAEHRGGTLHRQEDRPLKPRSLRKATREYAVPSSGYWSPQSEEGHIA